MLQLRFWYLLLILNFQIFSVHSFELPKFKFSDLNGPQKVQLLKALRELHATDSRESERVYSLKSYNESFLNLRSLENFLIPEAFAKESSINCLYAGWGSTLTKGYCARPSSNSSSSYDHGNCSDQELHCNPALFGHGLCIDISTQAARNNAFVNCEDKYKKDGRTFESVIGAMSEETFLSAVKQAEDICNNSSLKQSRTEMCSVIKKKFEQFIPQKTSPSHHQARRALSRENTEELSSSLESLVREIERNAKTLEEKCSDDPILASNRIICESAAHQILSDQKLADDIARKLNVQIQQGLYICSQPQTTMPSEDLSAGVSEAVAQMCSDEEIREKKASCGEEIKCAIASSVIGGLSGGLGTGLLAFSDSKCLSNENNCLVHLFTSLASYLISSIKSIFDLLAMGYDWAKEKGSEFWTWLTEAEDETSKAQENIQHLSEADVKAIEEDSAGWLSRTLSGVGDMLNEWIKTEVFCEQWSGVPNFSTCEKPMTSWACVSCGTMYTGMCQMAGPIVGLIGETVLTGGSVAALSKGSKGAKAAILAMKASPKYSQAMRTVKASSFVTRMTVGKSAILATARVEASAAIKLSGDALAQVAKAASSQYQKIAQSQHIARAGEVLKRLGETIPGKAAKVVIAVDDAAYAAGYQAVDKGIDSAARIVTTSSRSSRVADAVTPDISATRAAQAPTPSTSSSLSDLSQIKGRVGEISVVEAEMALNALQGSSKAEILRLGLAPKTSYIAPDGTQILLSEKFLIGNREAFLAYVIKDGQVFQRTIYKSNSQGIFRWTDGILRGHYSKGVGEEFMVLPPDFQKQLNQMKINEEPKILTGRDIQGVEIYNEDFRGLEDIKENAKDSTGIFEKTEGIGNVEKLPDFYITNGVQTSFPISTKSKKMSYDKPSEIRIKKPNLNPDFSNPVDSYEITTGTSGRVQVEVYKSKDASLSFTVMKDSAGKVWIADVYPNHSSLNQFGIPAKQPDLGDLAAPRWEYKIQVHPDYDRGIPNPMDSEYISNWNYVREIPVIQDYYRSKGLAVPAAE